MMCSNEAFRIICFETSLFLFSSLLPLLTLFIHTFPLSVIYYFQGCQSQFSHVFFPIILHTYTTQQSFNGYWYSKQLFIFLLPPWCSRTSCKYWYIVNMCEQTPVYTSRWYWATLALIWSCFSDPMVNVPPILTLLLALFWSPPPWEKISLLFD